MLLSFAATLFLVLPQATSPPALGVEVTHLGNEGFLLRSGEATVLIDAFLEEPYSVYEPLGPKRFDALLGAEGPFGGPVTCLVSHRHRDHFQPAPAAAYLRNNPRARLLSSPEVVALLREENPAVGGGPQVEALYPEEDALERKLGPGLTVRWLDLRHGGERWKDLQNLGHDLSLGGLRILHVGDADTAPDDFRRHDLGAIEFDLALLPYWYFEYEGGRDLIAECIRAKHYVACHVPPKERTAFRQRSARVSPKLWIPGPEDEPRVFVPEPDDPASATGR